MHSLRVVSSSLGESHILCLIFFISEWENLQPNDSMNVENREMRTKLSRKELLCVEHARKMKRINQLALVQ